MLPLPRFTGYLFLVLLIVSVWTAGAGVAATIWCALQAAVVVVAQHRPATRGRSLLAQLVLTYLPVAGIGPSGLETDHLLAATALWCLPPRWRWAGFATVAAISGPLHAQHRWGEMLHLDITTAAIGAVVYLLSRLTVLVDALDATRDELAQLTQTRERLQVARRLRDALGDRLTAVLDLLRRARTDLTPRPDRATAAVADATDATRRIIAAVRELAAEQHDSARMPPDDVPISRLAPRLALSASVISLGSWVAVEVLESPGARIAMAFGGTALAGLLLAQLLRPEPMKRLLVPQALIALAPLPWLGATWSVWLILLAVSVLVCADDIRLAVAVPALVGLRAIYGGPPGNGGPGGHWSWLVMAAEATLVLFGLARFLQLSRQLNRSRQDLIQVTTQVERLRLARDIHDLLGLTLSVLVLKGDLITELVHRDPVRAATEIEEALRIASRARAEAWALADTAETRSLCAELRVAGAALADACGTVSIDCDDELPVTAGAVLAPVVREAVTNVLRHSTATRVRIECRRQDGDVRLEVHNDGAADESEGAGQGLRNMRARVRDAGGSFSAARSGGEFRLTARVPC
ncbi:sensor histidine kinase [Nocardia stercoris]|uniref:Uncharacterized protein n=1 Tax=Nocardia stercoris TaxID=2483361 RepID=A0A3M2L9V5_9NOCA|nr:histidine kinase [Nocardia stercoris]RMI34379.1 hypothetical protein EBN03_08340 [Nocardia stercoris]